MNIKTDIEAIVDGILREHGYLLDQHSSEFHRVRLLMCMAGARAIVLAAETMQAAMAAERGAQMLDEIVRNAGFKKAP